MYNNYGFTNAASSVGGGSTTLTVVNNSSVERLKNEKVWIRQIIGGWEIIDWALADVNSLTAKCDEAIAVGGTGTVSLADDGQVMQHLVRNFTLGAGVQESEINDASKLFTYNAYASSGNVDKYLVSGQLDLPDTQLNDLLLKVTFKFSPVDPNAGLTQSNITGLLLSTTYVNSTNFPTGNDYNYYPHIRASGEGVNQLIGEFRASLSTRKISLSYGSVVNFDKWITALLRFDNNASPNARFDMSDNIGNSDYGSINYITSSQGNIQRAFIGTNPKLDYQITTVIDLAKTGLYTADGSTALWEPYKQSVV